MFEETIQLRVRYHDCDPLGIVYHGHYAKFFEIGRTEAMRKHDFSYKKLEELGFAMPVVEMNIKYFRPARYDELMDIKTIIKEWPDKKIVFGGYLVQDLTLTNNSYIVARYNSDGSFNDNFSGDGKIVFYNFSGKLNAMDIQQDEKIIIGGTGKGISLM